MVIHVVKNDGLLALYNGLSASLCRQVRVTGCHFVIMQTEDWMEGVCKSSVAAHLASKHRHKSGGKKKKKGITFQGMNRSRTDRRSIFDMIST